VLVADVVVDVDGLVVVVLVLLDVVVLVVDGVVVDDVVVLVVDGVVVVVLVVVLLAAVRAQSRGASLATVLTPVKRLALSLGLTVTGSWFTEAPSPATARGSAPQLPLSTALEIASSLLFRAPD
jgi:hypothetical protein